ncbi:MAG: hypothetical protein E7158_02755 [Firmicutes bacterium]|nr:hypothetical protein [Bacillota bacterium]
MKEHKVAKEFIISLCIIVFGLVAVLGGYALGRYYKGNDGVDNKSSNEIDTNENKNDEIVKYDDFEGNLDISDDQERVSEILNVNGKKHELTYIFNEQDYGNGTYGPGIEDLIYDNKIIKEESAAEGIGTVTYNIFTAKDKKQYVLIKENNFYENVYILDENGNILKEFSNRIEEDNIDCLAYSKDNSSTTYIENGSVYYNKYDSLESKSDYTAKMNKIKIDINDRLITETNIGEQVIMQLGQCS